jgi:hypothetical protein
LFCNEYLRTVIGGSQNSAGRDFRQRGDPEYSLGYEDLGACGVLQEEEQRYQQNRCRIYTRRHRMSGDTHIMYSVLFAILCSEMDWIIGGTKQAKGEEIKSRTCVRQPIIHIILQLLLEGESRTGKPRTGTKDLPAIIWMRSPIIGRGRRAKRVE